ncbi:hypothetical protein B0T22DRAFT_256384 [Podospora appendiculata]|uniref:RNA polymerase II assembly factor Rtp1 C-terminal domain-containing protein n=1 Tax=Podospora appendiculata TaxID=314037 RepID=A0AAE0X2T9_9PEZI|nr:hypothetical protein B0T22DRAFT_256384 [Podospora appendiculata]
MDEAAPEKSARQRLMESIMDLGNRAFNPDATGESQKQAQRDFDDLIRRTRTFGLVAALNILVRPDHTPPWLRARLMKILTAIPVRPDGVRATLEFVFAVHPSSTVKTSEAAEPQKRGANITHEALEMTGRLVSVPPSSVTPETWYAAVAPQLLVLLDGTEGPELMKAAAYIIGFGILGRKASGAPGTAGWKYLAEPMTDSIKPPPAGPRNRPVTDTDMDEVIDLSKEKVLVTQNEMATALRRLHSLVVSHPNPGLCKRLLTPLLLPLWSLSSWVQARPSISEKVCVPAQELLKIFLVLSSSPDILLTLVRHLGYVGGWDQQNPEWVYKDVRGELQIVDARRRPLGSPAQGDSQISMEDIDQKIPKLLDLATATLSDTVISTAFLSLFGRWLESTRTLGGDHVLVKQEKVEQDPMMQLMEVKMLQAMMDKFPEKLANQPTQLLGLVSKVLAGYGDRCEGEDDDGVTGVALSLLNMVITVPGFQKSKIDPEVITLIESSLETLSRSDDMDIARTASNMALLLRYRDELDDLTETSTAPTDRQIEDRKTYSLAISYISQADSPPPVRSEGLNLISNLITSHSPILDIPGILVLMSSLMRDSEDYINLQVIKIFTLLTDKHPKAVTNELLDHYADRKETETVDSRLRFGEALLQVVERLGESFTGDVAQQVGDALISIASRRGHRPKTEAKQAKEERLRQQKNKEAEEAWDGPVPDLSEDMTPEEQAKNDILNQIVEGWESKRGTEDVRIRASALSILANAMETNIAGLGPMVVSTAVDLCISTLQVEPEMEKGILRRSAILLVMSFVRALDKAKQTRRRLGFGLAAQDDIMRTLRYVAQTDNDGLVQQHARDVLESLQNWQMSSLVTPEVETLGQQTAGLTRLAGLAVNPDRSAALGGRPRIEEIE